MADISTTVTASVSLATKAIEFAQRVALYEQRAITVTASATDDLPSGTYQLAVLYGGRTVALAALAESGGAAAGTLNLSTTQLQAVFDILHAVKRIRADVLLWDSAGKVLWARGGLDVWRNEFTDESPDPVPVKCEVLQGQQPITENATSVTVDLSGYTIGATASVVGSVLLPAGATEGVAVIGVTFSTTAAVFELSAAVGVGYKLAWMVAQ